MVLETKRFPIIFTDANVKYNATSLLVCLCVADGVPPSLEESRYLLASRTSLLFSASRIPISPKSEGAILLIARSPYPIDK